MSKKEKTKRPSSKERKRKSEAYRTIKNKKLVTAVYLLLRLSVIITMVLQLLNHNYENVFLCLLTLVLFILPSIIERRLHVDLPDALEIILLLFIYAAEILGEIREYYITIPFWDTMLHTINGFMFAAIGFSIVDVLNRNKHTSLTLSPFYMAIAAFCFSMTIGVMWEFFERFMDVTFGLDMQKDTILDSITSVTLNPDGKNIAETITDIKDVIIVQSDGTQISLGLGGYLDIGLLDTMMDLLVNLIGAVIFSVIGYFYIKHRGKGKFATMFIPKIVDTPEADTAESAGEENTPSPTPDNAVTDSTAN